jgi:hypothetical protein
MPSVALLANKTERTSPLFGLPTTGYYNVMFRTRFKKEIVAEFLPPAHPRKKQRIIILCDGMPSVPRKQPLMTFLAGKG